jgi:hypothetical protein
MFVWPLCCFAGGRVVDVAGAFRTIKAVAPGAHTTSLVSRPLLGDKFHSLLCSRSAKGVPHYIGPLFPVGEVHNQQFTIHQVGPLLFSGASCRAFWYSSLSTSPSYIWRRAWRFRLPLSPIEANTGACRPCDRTAEAWLERLRGKNGESRWQSRLQRIGVRGQYRFSRVCCILVSA